MSKPSVLCIPGFPIFFLASSILVPRAFRFLVKLSRLALGTRMGVVDSRNKNHVLKSRRPAIYVTSFGCF